MHPRDKCRFRFQHESRPRPTCDRDVTNPSSDGLCSLHRPRRSVSRSLRSELESAISDDLHWLEGIAIEDADLSGLQALGAKLPYARFQGSNLSGAALAEALLDHADFRSANLSNATLTRASLRATTLVASNLTGAHLEHTIMSGANCEGAIASGTYLFGAQLSPETTLLDVNVSALGELSDGDYSRAAQVFRNLDAHFQSRADYRRSDDCYYRAMSATHTLEGGTRNSLSSQLYWALHRGIWGYGIRPWRVIAWALGVIITFGTVIYPVIGVRDATKTSHDIGQGLALSVVTFATLGYGNRTPASLMGEFIAGVEAISGAVLTSLLLVALATKYVRRG